MAYPYIWDEDHPEPILSYDELMALANLMYNQGGDSVYECWDEKDFDEYVKECGPITVQKALEIFGLYDAIRKDIEATAW